MYVPNALSQTSMIPILSQQINIQEDLLDEVFKISEDQSIGGVSKIKLDDHTLYIVGEKHSESQLLKPYLKKILNFQNVVVLEEGQNYSCNCDKCHPDLGLEDKELHIACLNIINRRNAYKKNTPDKHTLPFPSKSFFEKHDRLKAYVLDYKIFLEEPTNLLSEIISEPRNEVFVRNIQKIIDQNIEKYIVVRVGEIHRSFITLYFLMKYETALAKISYSKKLNLSLYEKAKTQLGIYTLSIETQEKAIAKKNAIYYLKLIHRNRKCEEITAKRPLLENYQRPQPLETQALNPPEPSTSTLR